MAAAFDAVAYYSSSLSSDESKSYPISAIETLAAVIEQSSASTMIELLQELQSASARLTEASFSPISISAGCNLLLRFVTLQRPSGSFSEHRRNLAKEARAFVKSSKLCAHKIIQEAATFINDGSVILTHSYSRIVSQTLIYAATNHRKRFSVYVTEGRPFGLGVKTHAVLTKAGIPCTVVLDSAVGYVMGKVDLCLLGAEGVAESGGIVNSIGSFNIALAASAYQKPLFALAESFKFLRLFPLSQFDLPTATDPLLFQDIADTPAQSKIALPKNPSKLLKSSPWPVALEMTQEQINNNPTLDYTGPEHLTGIISDVGVLTPSAVADTLLSMFGGE